MQINPARSSSFSADIKRYIQIQIWDTSIVLTLYLSYTTYSYSSWPFTFLSSPPCLHIALLALYRSSPHLYPTSIIAFMTLASWKTLLVRHTFIALFTCSFEVFDILFDLLDLSNIHWIGKKFIPSLSFVPFFIDTPLIKIRLQLFNLVLTGR